MIASALYLLTLIFVILQVDGLRYLYVGTGGGEQVSAGCTLSAAIAAYLAQRLPLVLAVQAAHRYVHSAIAHGAPVRTGHGVGPLNHGYAPLVMPLQVPCAHTPALAGACAAARPSAGVGGDS